MKTISFIIAALIISLTGCQSKAGITGKTETFKVYGNCSMCKERIEKAAIEAGVQKADWNIETKILAITFDSTKVKAADVQTKIAAVGHDTELAKADDKAYDALPGCCKYERKKD
jgi:periplasmic mercuric ion binding protein